jgi:hypothetical protein
VMGLPNSQHMSGSDEQKAVMCEMLKEFAKCLPIKLGFRPYKQPAGSFKPEIVSRVKEEVDRLLQAGFIHPYRYVEWASNIVPVEKNTGKIRVCIDFRKLNRATPKDEYLIPIADALIDNTSGNKMINFMDGNAGYNQIFMAEGDVSKTAFFALGLYAYLNGR